jgi:hypothetical protein
VKQLFKVLCDFEDVERYTPALVGDSEQWSSIVSAAEENRQSFCKALSGKTLFSALYGMYTVALQKLKALLKTSNPADPTKTTNPALTQKDGFTEVWRRKRHSTNKAAPTIKKAAAAIAAAIIATPLKDNTRNFFAPLRTTSMDTNSSGAEVTTHEEAVPGKASRLLPITNLLQL